MGVRTTIGKSIQISPNLEYIIFVFQLEKKSFSQALSEEGKRYDPFKQISKYILSML
jgi:hypothetical protein